MGIKISILGCGWLGFPLAESLIYKGFQVKGSVRSQERVQKLEKKGINPFLINLGSAQNDYLAFCDSEILIIAVPEKEVAGFANLIEQIEKSNIKKVIYISSTSVYENSNEEVTEATPVKDCPLSRIEELFRNKTRFETTVIRFAGLFGYDRKPVNFIPKTKPMQNPIGFVNLVHRDDCIGIIEEIIRQNCWGETFNACADSHPARREFYTEVAKKEGQSAPKFDENSANNWKIVSSNKLKTKLNYSFQYVDIM